MKNPMLYSNLSRTTLLVAVFLTPLILIPLAAAPFQFTKYILFALALVVSLGLLIGSWVLKGRIEIMEVWPALAAFFLPLAYLLSALFAPHVGFGLIGNGADVDTFASYLLAAVAFLLGMSVFRSRKSAMMLLGGLALSLLLIGLFQVARILFGSLLAFGPFATATANLFGKWNDLGILAGLIALLSMLALSLFMTSRLRLFSWVLLALSLAMMAAVNFPLSWWLLGIGALMLLIGQGISRMRTTGETRTKISISAFSVLVISILFLIFSTSVGTVLSESFNVAHLEARPSWESTGAVLSDVYQESGVLGIGSNHFSRAWQLHRPDVVNNTIFWSVDFNAGVSTVATSAISAGLLGLLAWFAFLGLFLSRIFRYARAERYDDEDRSLVLMLFAASLYLFIVLLLYVPGSILFLLAFLIAGAALGLAATASGKDAWGLTLAANPRFGFAGLGLTILLFVVSVAVLAGVGVRYVVAWHLQGATIAFNQDQDVREATAGVERAISIGGRSQEFRVGVEIGLALMREVVNQPGEVTEERRQQFQGLLTQTIAYGIRATEVDPQNYLNWVALGRVYEALVPLEIEGAYENAKLVYERARTLSPQNPSIPLALARLELSQNNRDEGRERIGDALRLKSNYTEAIFLLSQLEIAEGNVEAAIQSVRAASVLVPTNPTVFFQLGFLEYATGDFDAARQALEQAVALNDMYANARYFLGLSYYQLERIDDALDQFRRVEASNPDNEEVRTIISNLKEGRPPLSGVVPETPPEERDELPVEE